MFDQSEASVELEKDLRKLKAMKNATQIQQLFYATLNQIEFSATTRTEIAVHMRRCVGNCWSVVAHGKPC